MAIEPPHQHARAALHRPGDHEGGQAPERRGRGRGRAPAAVQTAQARGGVGHRKTADAHTRVDGHCTRWAGAVVKTTRMIAREGGVNGLTAGVVEVVGVEKVSSRTDDALSSLNNQFARGVRGSQALQGARRVSAVLHGGSATRGQPQLRFGVPSDLWRMEKCRAIADAHR